MISVSSQSISSRNTRLSHAQGALTEAAASRPRSLRGRQQQPISIIQLVSNLNTSVARPKRSKKKGYAYTKEPDAANNSSVVGRGQHGVGGGEEALWRPRGTGSLDEDSLGGHDDRCCGKGCEVLLDEVMDEGGLACTGELRAKFWSATSPARG
jgi:hypothetical protein